MDCHVGVINSTLSIDKSYVIHDKFGGITKNTRQLWPCNNKNVMVLSLYIPTIYLCLILPTLSTSAIFNSLLSYYHEFTR